MKKLKLIIGFLGFAIMAGVAIFGLPEAVESFLGIGSVLATLPIWFVMKGEVKEFVEIKDEAVLKALSVEDLNAYIIAKNENYIDTLVIEIKTANKEEKAKLEAKIKEIQIENLTPLTKSMQAMSKEIAKLKNSGVTGAKAENRIKSAWDEEAAKFTDGISKETFSKESAFKIAVTKDVTYGDITGDDELSPVRTSVTDIAVRKPVFADLFNKITISGEFYKYLEQTTVVRDADNVAKCAPPASKLTKEELTVASIETKMIKDIIPFCLTYISDYPFMEGRIRFLLNQSLVLRVDQQILLGTGLLEETFSIDEKSSEFSAALAEFPLTAKIATPNIANLAGGMACQIEILGEENAFMPNVLLMNKGDFFLLDSEKDSTGRSLSSEVINYVNGDPYIKGLLVRTSPLIVTNTMYVMDSTKGDIVMRKEIEVSISTENGVLWEKEFAEIKGVTRLNLLIETNNSNAFMKCSDIATALVAITKV